MRLATVSLLTGQEPASLADAAERTTAGVDNPTDPSPNLFARRPDGRYRIAYDGKEDTVQGLAGLRVAEYLLKQPGKAAHVLEINRALAEGTPRAAALEDAFARSEEQEGLDGFTADASRQPDPCSEEDLEKAKEAVKSLDDQATTAREEGNHEEADRLELSADKGRQWIREQEALARRKRRGQPDQDSPAEGVRSKLTTNFKNALEALRTKYSFPELADHLEAQISSGTNWRYNPVPGVEWVFDLDRR
jgi:hypothetical protein